MRNALVCKLIHLRPRITVASFVIFCVQNRCKNYRVLSFSLDFLRLFRQKLTKKREINKLKVIMRKNIKLHNSLINESYTDEAQDVVAPESIVVLTFREMVEVIMLTVAAMKSDDTFISETQKYKRGLRLPKNKFISTRI